MLSNIVKNSNIWAGDFLEEPAEETYMNWKKRMDGLTYHFQQDLKTTRR